MKLAVYCAFTMLVSGADAQSISRSQLNSSFEIKYGVIAGLEKVETRGIL
jgi:hypothetical protein